MQVTNKSTGNQKPDGRKTPDIGELLMADRQRLLAVQPFIGNVLMNLELVQNDGIETARTDGVHIEFSSQFMRSLDPDQRLFLLAHEAWHCVLFHRLRRQKRHAVLFNFAADIEINFMLYHSKLKGVWPKDEVRQFDGMSAEEIYEHMRKDPSWIELAWKKYAALNTFYGTVETDVDLLDSPPMSRNDIDKMRGACIRAAIYAERSGLPLSANVKKVIDMVTKSELNWRELLRRYMLPCFGGARKWLPPERRHVHRGLYLPSYRDDMIEVCMAIDTSGSTSELQGKFCAEMMGLLRSFGRYELTVIQCDCRIQKVEKFSYEKPLPADYKWNPIGFGCTDLRIPFEYLAQRKKPKVFVYVTDGEGPAPATPPPYPVIWVMPANGKSPCDWGNKIFLKEEWQ